MDRQIMPSPGESRPPEIENFYLLQRLFAGALLLGTSELTRRLREWQQTIDADPERLWAGKDFDAETGGDTLVYFMLGSLLRLEKTGVSLASSGIEFMQQAAQNTANFLQPLLDSPLTRPFQRPIASISQAVGQQVRRSIQLGRYEDQRSRVLTETTFLEVIDELLDFLAKNPEVRELIQQQGISTATTVLDNGREMVVAADSVVEAALRRLLRMTPRAELPESPLTGKPQEMYSPERWEKALQSDDNQ
jgi:hypothetical protein